MKILLVTEYFTPHWTGIVKAAEKLAESLEKQGHQVSVLTTQYDPQLPLKQTINKLSIIRVPYLWHFSRTCLAPQTIWQTIMMIKKFDIVVINSPHSLILPISIVAKLFSKSLFIFHQGDLMLPRQTGNQVFNRIMEKVFDLMTIPACTLADGVSCSIKDYAEHSRVLKYFTYKFQAFIPNLSKTTKKPRAAFVNKMARLKKNHRLIGIAGRFVEEKGFDILLKALPQIIDKVPTAHVVFAGQTKIEYEPFFEKCQALIAENKNHFTVLGLLDEADLNYFYKALDVFVISSRSDCFPLSQMEAALSGVPLVCTDIPGARMLIQETGAGIIVKPEAPQDLARGIIDLLSSPTRSGIHSINIDSRFPHFAQGLRGARRGTDRVISFFNKYDTFRIN